MESMRSSHASSSCSLAVAPSRRRPQQQHLHQAFPWGTLPVAASLALGLLVMAGQSSAFISPVFSPCTTAVTNAGRGVPCAAAARDVHAATICGRRVGRSWRTVDLTLMATRKRRREGAILEMVMGSNQQQRAQGTGGMDGKAGYGYGIPREASIELIRLELAEVPVGEKHDAFRVLGTRRLVELDQHNSMPTR